MWPVFDLPGSDQFVRSSVLPPEYKGFVLPGSRILSARGENGTMILQEIDEPLFRISFQVFNFFRPVKLAAFQHAAKLVSFLALKNAIRYSITGLGTLPLKQGRFALLHCREHEVVARFDKGVEYQAFEISWSEDILQQALPYFSLLDPLFTSRQRKQSYFLPSTGSLASPKAMQLVQEMLKSPFDQALSRLFFEHKVREYLLILLVDAGKKAASGLHLSPEEWDKVNRIARALETEPDKKFPIARLAADTGMNSMKLKMAFKERFRQGIFEYQLSSRMKEALRLLQETDLNTKSVASMVGYQRPTSFITKFREYFGYPPSQVQRIK